MARSSNPFDTDDEPELSIAPLIDVAFLLLIFFLVTTTLVKQEADLGLSLPGITQINSEPVKIDQMLIHISSDGAILVNKEIVESDVNRNSLPNLTDRLTRYVASAQIAGSEAMVVVDCDEDAMEQRFIDVLNSCARAGIVHLTITQ